MQDVSRADHDALVQALSALPGSDIDGFFGPGSMSWRVNRESSVFLGAGRAALLQIAHPWVAAALAEHSSLLQDPIARFHGTFRVVYTMVFGTRAQALAAARRLWRTHAAIAGTLPGTATPYRANEAEALLWVYATLVESAILAHELAQGPLSAAERQRYYEEGRRVAMLCGVPAAVLPLDWQRFTHYTAAMLASSTLSVDEGARLLGDRVLRGAGSFLPVPHWYRDVTAAWLPPRLRHSFGLAFGAAEQQRVQMASRWIGRVYPFLPRQVRYVGPYLEAASRVGGNRAGALGRAWMRSNTRVWTGRDSLLSVMAESH